MSGIFGIVSGKDCIQTLFYGTDYHSHLGSQVAGLAVGNHLFKRSIHDISTAQFKSKFVDELPKLKGKMGIGVISDSTPQPIIVSSFFGTFALVANGFVGNKDKLAKELIAKGSSFTELSKGEINWVELIGRLISQQRDILTGIEYMFEKIKGACSFLILTKEGIYATRDQHGRSTLIVGQRGKDLAVTSETCAFLNLGFIPKKELRPGEVVLLSKNGLEIKRKGTEKRKICAFLWIYTGDPASSYEGINVAVVREKCGMNLAKTDRVKADLVSGVPDSGIIHALGYAKASKIPYRTPLIKYTAGYGRSYIPPSQKIRNQVAQMKLIPVKEIIEDKKIIICDDSIVRGTQLKNQGINKLWRCGAREIHARIACPPLLFPCPYTFSTRTKRELAARRAIKKIFGKKEIEIAKFIDEDSIYYKKMVEAMRKELGVTSLKFQNVKQMIKAIGLPKKDLCLYCWLGK